MPFVKGQGYFPYRKPKTKTIDTAITFRTSKIEKNNFINTCNALGMQNGKVLRSFMKKFVEDHANDEEVLNYLKSEKVQEVSK